MKKMQGLCITKILLLHKIGWKGWDTSTCLTYKVVLSFQYSQPKLPSGASCSDLLLYLEDFSQKLLFPSRLVILIAHFKIKAKTL